MKLEPGIKVEELGASPAAAAVGSGASGTSPSGAAAGPVLGPVKEEIRETTSRLNSGT